MKTLRLIGMALLAVVLCVNFTACSDDDETEVSLEGTWGVIHDKGLDYSTNESWEDEYNPYTPSEDNCKWVIEKLNDNTYSFIEYSSDAKGNWEMSGDWTGVLNGKTFALSMDFGTNDEEPVINPRNSEDNCYITINELTTSNLKIYLRYMEKDGENYEETITFIRIQ